VESKKTRINIAGKLSDFLCGLLAEGSVVFRVLGVGFAVMLLTPERADAYIGPGAGFAVMGSFMVMFITLLLAVLLIFTWPIRYLFRAIRGRKAFAKSRVKRFIVLGFDGMDPKLTRKFLDEGKLPNFARLRDNGCFKELGSTVPPISPVAWSSFQTGVNPGKHNIFDFLTRDKRTYYPRLSSVDIRPPRRKIKIGKYQFPIGKADIRLLRKGKPFWKTLGEHGVFSNIIRVPITFPPEKFRGVQLSAMCVPDLRGTQGMFSYYTERAEDIEQTGGETLCVTRNGNVIEAKIIGPSDPLGEDGGTLACSFKVNIKNAESATLKMNGSTHTLKVGEYSEWIKAEFNAGFGIKVSGICKILLVATEPDFKMYVTPVNIDPEKPAMPISQPAVYSTYFAKLLGPFATLGLAEDSWALNENILNDDGFLQQAIDNDAEREQMFMDSLDKVKHGLCVCVFDGTDRIQHSFWRYIDDKHPAFEGQSPADQQRRDAIEQVYKRADVLLGKTLDRCDDEETVLMVVSDHGFNTFRYGIDLNKWLLDNGYLKLKDGASGKQYLEDVDWSQTRAFAIGLTGMFLNIKGRESKGIVDPGDEASRLREEIAEKLSSLMDPIRNEPAIKQVYNAMKVYKGPYKTEAPDLIVGYDSGYRASWDTAVGRVTDMIFHDNKKAWSGDHCVDQSVVPGVIFCNRDITTQNPRLMDIGPTVLDMFGVETPANMDGKALEVSDHKDSDEEVDVA
jgi:predicted AlkP superfamily phosphohydrolase/phosphomutase